MAYVNTKDRLSESRGILVKSEGKLKQKRVLALMKDFEECRFLVAVL